jgi:hypothetical protein
LHMLRVTKELQTLIKGGEFTQKQKKELEKVSCCPLGGWASAIFLATVTVTCAKRPGAAAIVEYRRREPVKAISLE